MKTQNRTTPETMVAILDAVWELAESTGKTLETVAAILDTARELAESTGNAPFHPFGACQECGSGLWPVDERDPYGPRQCENCAALHPGTHDTLTWRQLLELGWRDEPAPEIHPDYDHIARVIVASEGRNEVVIAHVSDGLAHIAPLLAAVPQLFIAAEKVSDSSRHHVCDLAGFEHWPDPWDLAELRTALQDVKRQLEALSANRFKATHDQIVEAEQSPLTAILAKMSSYESMEALARTLIQTAICHGYAPPIAPAPMVKALVEAATEYRGQGRFQEFGVCPSCNISLWPVDEWQPREGYRCSQCQAVYSPDDDRIW